MKKKCAWTRKALPNYLRGHVFRITRNRIERHLGQCVICKSEFEALKRADETRQILKYVNASEGVVHRMREGVSVLAKLKKILYRPLWLAAIVLVSAGAYYYAMMPRQLDLEIENIVKTAPATIPAATPTPVPAPAGEQRTAVTLPTVSVQKPVPSQEPLTVVIIPEDDQTAVRKINEVMQGHGLLRDKKFSDTQREVSGSLTEKELLTLFARIAEVGKISYSQKRLESFPTAQPIPFVLRLQALPKPAEYSLPTAKPVQKPAETQATGGAAIPASPATDNSLSETNNSR